MKTTNLKHFMRKEQLKVSVSQLAQALERILEEQACQLAKEPGFIQRERAFSGADFAQTLIFGWLQTPQETLSGLVQIAGRRQVQISESGLCQRFTPPAAAFMKRLLERLAEVQLESKGVESKLLSQFSEVIVEDSSSILLPNELAQLWRGCGGKEGMSQAMVKLFVRWNVLSGQVQGPELADGKTNDHHSPFPLSSLAQGSLYLADLGFFAVQRLVTIARGQSGQGPGHRFFVTRWQPGTALYTQGGHRLELRGILPQQVGQVREMGVLLSRKDRLAVRLILVKVPAEVALARQERIKRAAQKHGREPNPEVLELAHWTIVLTNLSPKQADWAQVLVLMRLRWQIERLFRLWKEDGHIDEWRSRNPYRMLCELYGKLCAMLIQQGLVQEGCWHDPFRSLVKAAQVVRREANRIMLALSCGEVEATLHAILRLMRSGCRLQRRGASPSTAQLLEQGLDWNLQLLLT